jgi:hypothetical protein
MENTFYSNILKLTEENENTKSTNSKPDNDKINLLMRCYLDILEYDIRKEIEETALKGLRSVTINCMDDFCNKSVYSLLINKYEGAEKNGIEQLKDRFNGFKLNLTTENRNEYTYITSNISLSYTYGGYTTPNINLTPKNRIRCNINVSW